MVNSLLESFIRPFLNSLLVVVFFLLLVGCGDITAPDKVLGTGDSFAETPLGKIAPKGVHYSGYLISRLQESVSLFNKSLSAMNDDHLEELYDEDCQRLERIHWDKTIDSDKGDQVSRDFLLRNYQVLKGNSSSELRMKTCNLSSAKYSVSQEGHERFEIIYSPKTGKLEELNYSASALKVQLKPKKGKTPFKQTKSFSDIVEQRSLHVYPIEGESNRYGFEFVVLLEAKQNLKTSLYAVYDDPIKEYIVISGYFNTGTELDSSGQSLNRVVSFDLGTDKNERFGQVSLYIPSTLRRIYSKGPAMGRNLNINRSVDLKLAPQGAISFSSVKVDQNLSCYLPLGTFSQSLKSSHLKGKVSKELAISEKVYRENRGKFIHKQTELFACNDKSISKVSYPLVFAR